MQAFINTRLYYCKWLYFGIADGLMSRLQSVQNAAARLISGSVTPCGILLFPGVLQYARKQTRRAAAAWGRGGGRRH